MHVHNSKDQSRKRFKVEKALCEHHNVRFKKYIRANGTVKVSCRRYQQCRKEAIERHEDNIAEAKLSAEKEGRSWMAVKAVLQIVCPHEEPSEHIPKIL